MSFSHPGCFSLLIALVIVSSQQFATAASSGTDELFEQLDANNDGWLQRDEVDLQNTRLFTRLLRSADADDDDQLSPAEFEHGLQPQRVAKPLPEKQGTKLPGTDALMLLLAQMNPNGDRTITSGEVPKELQGFFKQIQTKIGGEQDGKITQREITQAAPRLSQMALRFTEQRDIDVEVELALLPEKQFAALERLDAPNRPGDSLSDPKQAEELFDRLDADDNGQVTPEEVPPPLADRFEQILSRGDQDQDGQLSKKELLAVSRRLEAFEKQRLSPAEVDRRLAGLLKQFDRNGDNLLSIKEIPRRLRDRFERLDQDGNRSLDRQELGRLVELLNHMQSSKVKRPAESPTRKKP